MRLLLDLIKAEQLSLFGRAKAPAGFSPIPGSKRGGYHKRHGAGYIYWYFDTGTTSVPHPGDAGSGSAAPKEPVVVQESNPPPAPPAGPPTPAAIPRAELKRTHRAVSKFSDLAPHGYQIVQWVNPKELAAATLEDREMAPGGQVFEYVPVGESVTTYTDKGPKNKIRPTSKPRYTATTYEEQVEVHRAIGAPVKPRGGGHSGQQMMLGEKGPTLYRVQSEHIPGSGAPKSFRLDARPPGGNWGKVEGGFSSYAAAVDRARQLREPPAAVPESLTDEEKKTLFDFANWGQVNVEERKYARLIDQGYLRVTERGTTGRAHFGPGNVMVVVSDKGRQHIREHRLARVRTMVEAGKLKHEDVGMARGAVVDAFASRMSGSPEEMKDRFAAAVEALYQAEKLHGEIPTTAQGLREALNIPAHWRVVERTDKHADTIFTQGRDRRMIISWKDRQPMAYRQWWNHTQDGHWVNVDKKKHPASEIIAKEVEVERKHREKASKGEDQIPTVIKSMLHGGMRLVLDLHGPRLILDLEKARRAANPRQLGMFGFGAARPPGGGWEMIPRGKHGGYRRRHGDHYEYWYPDKQAIQHAPEPGDPEEAPKPVPAPQPAQEKQEEQVAEAMSKDRTKGQRREANDEAVKIVMKARAEGRGLTDAEAVKVASYTGKGGISGDLNQFYTRTDIAEAMWDVMGAYQQNVQTVLEPSCGSGVFLQTAPKGVKVTGVELDDQAAAVAEVLHAHKGHTIESKAFEQFTIERMGTPPQFDAVIANPPYCTRTGDIPRHKPEYKSADQYFIDTSLDHMKDGGVAVLLIHGGVMGNRSPGACDFRERLLARAEVLDAFRLPNDIFAHVHCGIGADVLVVRKRDDLAGRALAYSQARGELQGVMEGLGCWDQQLVDGDYFEKHPDRILGKALTADETGWRATVIGDADKVPAALRDLTKAKIDSKYVDPAAKPVTADQLGEIEQMKVSLQAAQADIDVAAVPPALGNTQTIDSRRYIYIGEPPKWTLMESVDDVSQIITKSGDAAIKQAHEIAVELQELIRARDAGEFYKSRAIRRRVADKVRAWVKENGIPGSHRALGVLSKSAPTLIDFMACVDSNGELSDLLSKDAAVTLKAAEVDKADLLSVAAYTARRNRGYVPFEDLQHNWEGWESEDDARSRLLKSGDYATDGTADGAIQHMEDYLTGNLYEKLDRETTRMAGLEGSERAQVERQVDLIRKRLDTRRRSIDDIPLQLRVMGWMPLDWFNRWLNTPEGKKQALGWREEGKRVRLVYDQGVYTLEVLNAAGDVARHSSDGTDWLKYMNRLSLKKEKCRDVEEHVEKGFNEWIKASDLRGKLEELYNRTFNAEFRREYSGDPLGLEGIATGVVPHDYQNTAVRWAAETGRGILGQDVGLGKTFIAILLARLRKQQGLARRPMVVVPKSVATNWKEEIETLFPGSRVLVIGEHRAQSRAAKKKAETEARAQGLSGEAFDKYVEANSWSTASDDDTERNRKLASVKQNEYDLIVCTKPAFERIPLKHDTIERYEKEDFWYQRGARIDKIVEGSKQQQTADKRIEKLKASWAQDKLQQKFQHQMDMVFWEDLGVDTLIADEAHCFPSGTLIDGRPIETLRRGDLVSAFDHATGRVVMARVANVQIQVPDSLRRLTLDDGTTVICTGAHPIFTPDGYVLARDVLVGDSLYKNRCSYEGPMRMVQGDAGPDASPGMAPPAGTDRHRSSGADDRRGSGRRIASIPYPAGPRPEEGQVLEPRRVASVEVLEPTGDGTFGGLCPGGVVFNLEVDDHRTYFAEGVLVHNCYKNLYAARSRFGKNPKFLGGSGQSKQARKMQHMAHNVREQDPSNGVYLLTATPTKNSPLEVFNMLQHIDPQAFIDIGVRNSEEFIDRFCKLEDRLILTPPGRGPKKKGEDEEDEDETQFHDDFEGAGNLEEAQCVVGFTNLKELEGIMDKYMMLQTATDVGLKIPDAKQEMHLVDMTPTQKAVYFDLRAKAQTADSRKDPGGMFRMLDQMKKAAQDLSLYDPEEYPDGWTESPKYLACADEASKGVRERGGQIIFCDHNASHERLKKLLMERGLREDQIGIINAQVAPDSEARQRVGDRFNRGEIKVVIGNTGTMGEGVNLQGKKHAAGTTDIHHLDQPWDPGTLHQRNGRGVRQGNRAEQVNVHTYLAKGSFDGFRHSTLMGKERWLDKLRSGANDIDNDMDGQGLDEVEMLAMLSDNPDEALRLIKEKRASAESAWYTRQAQLAVDGFYSYQRKIERMGKMREGETRDRLVEESSRLKRQLLRNELLPLEIKALLNSGDTAPVAVNTYLTGEGDARRLAAGLIRAGTVIQEKDTGYGQPGRMVVEKVDLGERKLTVRSWGYPHSHTIDVDKIAEHGYTVSKYTAVDELREALGKNADVSYLTPLEAITHISPDVLAANQDMVDGAVREWLSKHGRGREMLVRDAGGDIVVAPTDKIGGLKIVYPWGKDRQDLVRALAEANKGPSWREWENPLLKVGRQNYGGGGYGYSRSEGLFSAVAKEAESAWEERRSA
ncbi:MAG: SNF2-related protein [Planctomycetes bacterium]|nr:SNF2-related protein [Planctomycetota bacterium]